MIGGGIGTHAIGEASPFWLFGFFGEGFGGAMDYIIRARRWTRR